MHVMNADRLRALRESRGLSRAQVARLSGLTEMTVMRLELGLTKDVKLETLKALAQAYGMTTAELVAFLEDEEGKRSEIGEIVEDLRHLTTDERRLVHERVRTILDIRRRR
jgi:transcriptional regulator with XRE-family HTH domain